MSDYIGRHRAIFTMGLRLLIALADGLLDILAPPLLLHRDLMPSRRCSRCPHKRAAGCPRAAAVCSHRPTSPPTVALAQPWLAALAPPGLSIPTLPAAAGCFPTFAAPASNVAASKARGIPKKREAPRPARQRPAGVPCAPFGRQPLHLPCARSIGSAALDRPRE